MQPRHGSAPSHVGKAALTLITASPTPLGLSALTVLLCPSDMPRPSDSPCSSNSASALSNQPCKPVGQAQKAQGHAGIMSSGTIHKDSLVLLPTRPNFLSENPSGFRAFFKRETVHGSGGPGGFQWRELGVVCSSCSLSLLPAVHLSGHVP